MTINFDTGDVVRCKRTGEILLLTEDAQFVYITPRDLRGLRGHLAPTGATADRYEPVQIGA